MIIHIIRYLVSKKFSAHLYSLICRSIIQNTHVYKAKFNRKIFESRWLLKYLSARIITIVQ